MKSNNKSNTMKETILLKATELIIKNGVKNTSLADIAKAVEISKGTLYYHYSSKDELICDIANIHLDNITNAVLHCVQGIDSNNSNEQMIKLIMEKIATIEGRGRIHMYILCEAITSNESLREQVRLKYIQWRKTLKSEVDKLETSDPEALSFLLVSIVDGLVVQGILKTEKIPYERVANFLVTHWR